MVDAFMLTVGLFLSAALAVGTARGVLAVVLHLMRLGAARPMRSAGAFAVRQYPLTSFDGAAPLVAREAA